MHVHHCMIADCRLVEHAPRKLHVVNHFAALLRSIFKLFKLCRLDLEGLGRKGGIHFTLLLCQQHILEDFISIPI